MGGRAVEGTGLENRQAATPRGFESHPIRQPARLPGIERLFTTEGAELIGCPPLVAVAEGDGLSRDAPSFFDAAAMVMTERPSDASPVASHREP